MPSSDIVEICAQFNFLCICNFLPSSKPLQAGLFVYDIFWVFFTPVMVSVAKSFDAPIKVSNPCQLKRTCDLLKFFLISWILHAGFHNCIINSFDAVYHSNCSSYSNSMQLLFPTADSARPFSMLGLGDIVIPGKFETFITCFVFLWSFISFVIFLVKTLTWVLTYSKSET